MQTTCARIIGLVDLIIDKTEEKLLNFVKSILSDPEDVTCKDNAITALKNFGNISDIESHIKENLTKIQPIFFLNKILQKYCQK